MAYQTLPNTFVSGATIYSTAVSANMVALLQGYTTGTYDGWFNGLIASGGVDVASGAASITCAGTLTVADVKVNNDLSVTGDVAITGGLAVTGNVSAGTADFAGAVEVAGALTVTGNVVASGAVTVAGDIGTVAWTAIGATSAAVTGFDNNTTSLNSYRYKQVGKTVFCAINLGGTSTGTTLSFTLPVTAGAGLYTTVFMGAGYDNGSAITTPSGAVIDTATSYTRVEVYKDLAYSPFTAANNKAFISNFCYESV